MLIRLRRRKIPPMCIRVHLHQCAFHQCDVASWLKGRSGLLAAICPLSAPPHPNKVPILFVFAIDPFKWSQVWSSDQYKTVSPRCGKSFLCHTRAFADIAVQIVGNYDFSSRGKYARISSYNWSMLKIKAVGGFSVMLLVLYVFCFCFFLFPRRVKC